MLKVKAPATEEFKKLPGYPSEERMKKGPVAIIECNQEIPCNPCEAACPKKAIQVGTPITNLPSLNEDTCIGCGLCVAGCPGQAIFILHKYYSETTSLIGFPYEYVPLPELGAKVNVVNRNGEVIGEGTIKKIQSSESMKKTNVVFVETAQSISEEVRMIER